QARWDGAHAVDGTRASSVASHTAPARMTRGRSTLTRKPERALAWARPAIVPGRLRCPRGPDRTEATDRVEESHADRPATGQDRAPAPEDQDEEPGAALVAAAAGRLHARVH